MKRSDMVESARETMEDLDQQLKDMMRQVQKKRGLDDVQMAKALHLPLRTYKNYLLPHHRFTLRSAFNFAYRAGLTLTIKLVERK